MEWTSCLSDPNNPASAATLNCIGPLLKNVIDWLLAFSGTAAVFFAIWSGLRIIASGGDAKQLDEARKGLAFSVLGLILVLLSFLIVNLASTITGLTCIKKFGFTNCVKEQTQGGGGIAPVENSGQIEITR